MKCNHDPKTMTGMPIGMYHCPDCGIMVLACEDHPEICQCKGYADYKDSCDICTPGWDKDLI
jgi:hypothetical protein